MQYKEANAAQEVRLKIKRNNQSAMKKFKLIKEYPGSAILGVMHSDENKLGEWKGYNYYEKYPEFWEDISNIIYLVLTESETPFNSWEITIVEANHNTIINNNRNFFKTKNEAEEFILYNKPCLSFNDIKEEMRCQVSQQGILRSILEIVKSKL